MTQNLDSSWNLRGCLRSEHPLVSYQQFPIQEEAWPKLRTIHLEVPVSFESYFGNSPLMNVL